MTKLLRLNRKAVLGALLMVSHHVLPADVGSALINSSTTWSKLQSHTFTILDDRTYGCVAVASGNIQGGGADANRDANQYGFAISLNDPNPRDEPDSERIVETIDNPGVNDPNTKPIATNRHFTDLTKANSPGRDGIHKIYLLGRKKEAVDVDRSIVSKLSVICVRTEKNYVLSAAKSGTGTGSISASGINCGSDCSEPYVSGTLVTLTATPSAESALGGWVGCAAISGTTCSVTMGADKTVTASFTRVRATLSVAREGSGTGSIVGSGINCGSDCSESYNLGTSAVLTATASTGSTFGGWSGCDSASGVSCTVTINSARTIMAKFYGPPQTVSLTPQYDNTVLVNSAVSNTATTVFQTTELAVGCNWTSNLYGEIYAMDYICARSLVRFNSTSLSGKKILSAKLKLITQYIGQNPKNWYVRALQSGWSPATVTWNLSTTLSYFPVSHKVLSPPSYAGQIVEIDVMQYVQNWSDGTWANNGIILGTENFTSPGYTSWDAFGFYPMETTGGLGPRLTVTFQ